MEVDSGNVKLVSVYNSSWLVCVQCAGGIVLKIKFMSAKDVIGHFYMFGYICCGLRIDACRGTAAVYNTYGFIIYCCCNGWYLCGQFDSREVKIS